MTGGICLKCGASSIHEVDTRGYADAGIPITSWRSAGLVYYICTVCGYTEIYVTDEKDREAIVEKKRLIRPH
jgi:predicted nucleic-acid-binding Zn-ribbon protein